MRTESDPRWAARCRIYESLRFLMRANDERERERMMREEGGPREMKRERERERIMTCQPGATLGRKNKKCHLSGNAEVVQP